MFKNTFLLLVMLVCVGCTKTVKSVTEVRDTVFVEHSTTDTLITQQRASDTLYVTRTDTVYQTLINNVLRRDSVYIREKGDTVLVYKEHWNTEHHYDTLYRAKTDTVWKVRSDTLYIYKKAEVADSTYQSHEKDRETVKERKDWKTRVVLSLFAFGVIGAVVWWLRRWLSNH